MNNANRPSRARRHADVQKIDVQKIDAQEINETPHTEIRKQIGILPPAG